MISAEEAARRTQGENPTIRTVMSIIDEDIEDAARVRKASSTTTLSIHDDHILSYVERQLRSLGYEVSMNYSDGRAHRKVHITVSWDHHLDPQD